MIQSGDLADVCGSIVDEHISVYVAPADGRWLIENIEGRGIQGRSFPNPDPGLTRRLRQAQALATKYAISPLISIDENREERGFSCAYHRSMAQLAFLSCWKNVAVLSVQRHCVSPDRRLAE